jgi:hypothetical protein
MQCKIFTMKSRISQQPTGIRRPFDLQYLSHHRLELFPKCPYLRPAGCFKTKFCLTFQQSQIFQFSHPKMQLQPPRPIHRLLLRCQSLRITSQQRADRSCRRSPWVLVSCLGHRWAPWWVGLGEGSPSATSRRQSRRRSSVSFQVFPSSVFRASRILGPRNLEGSAPWKDLPHRG